MTSQVDVTFPADNVKVPKSALRAQFLVISNEITALQARTSLAGAQAYYNYVTSQQLQTALRSTKVSLARDIAFNRVSL